MMWARHPAIARRWAKKYGSTPNKAGGGLKQAVNQAAQKKKPVVSKEEKPSTPTPTPLPRQKPKQSPPIYQRPVTPSPQPKQRPVVTPLPQQKPRPAESADRREQLTNALNRMKSRTANRSNLGGTRQALDRTQKMQRQGLMIKNVGGSDYTGPVNTREQNLRENTRKLK